jgi:hypothetical protein
VEAPGACAGLLHERLSLQQNLEQHSALACAQNQDLFIVNRRRGAGPAGAAPLDGIQTCSKEACMLCRSRSCRSIGVAERGAAEGDG